MTRFDLYSFVTPSSGLCLTRVSLSLWCDDDRHLNFYLGGVVSSSCINDQSFLIESSEHGMNLSRRLWRTRGDSFQNLLSRDSL